MKKEKIVCIGTEWYVTDLQCDYLNIDFDMINVSYKF